MCYIRHCYVLIQEYDRRLFFSLQVHNINHLKWIITFRYFTNTVTDICEWCILHHQARVNIKSIWHWIIYSSFSNINSQVSLEHATVSICTGAMSLCETISESVCEILERHGFKTLSKFVRGPHIAPSLCLMMLLVLHLVNIINLNICLKNVLVLFMSIDKLTQVIGTPHLLLDCVVFIFYPLHKLWSAKKKCPLAQIELCGLGLSTDSTFY